MHVWFRNIHLPSYDIRNSDVKQILDRFAISIILSQQTIHRWTPRRNATLVWLSDVIFHAASFVENSVSLPLRLFRRMQLEYATIETCFLGKTYQRTMRVSLCVCADLWNGDFSVHDILGLCIVVVLFLLRKSKDYVYGIWVYKALDIWKGYYRVKKSLVSYVKPWTEARNNRCMKYHSKLTYQLSFWNVSRKVDYHAGGKWFIHGPKRRKENQLLSLKHSCWLSLV